MNEGVLTAEWVAEHQAEAEKKEKAAQEKRERELLAVLKLKYEGQP